MRRNVRRLLLPLLVALTAATSCTVGPSTRPPLATYGGSPVTPSSSAPTSPSAPVGAGGPGRDVDPIAWSPCRGDVAETGPAGTAFDVDCGHVRVPTTYRSPGSTTFSLQLARARAAGVAPDAPALVVVSGEPGENGRADVAAVAEALPADIRNRFAVITLDLRGTGASVPVTCVSFTTVTKVISLDADPAAPGAADLLAKVARQITFDCSDTVGPNLTRFNSVESADDLDTLRAALGTPTMNFLGRGFGATLGAVYADRYPGRVGRMVLDSPSDPLATAEERAKEQAAAYAAALDAFSGACADFDGGCPLGDDPKARIAQAMSRLADSPEVSADQMILSDGSVLLALVSELGDLDSWPQLATALAAAADGTVLPLERLLVDRFRLSSRDNLFEGSILFGCNDSAQRLQPREAASKAGAMAKTDVFGRYLIGLVTLCSAWPTPEQPLGRVAATGAGPILVLGAVDDPVTPYDGVRSLSGQLSSAVLVSWQSGQHGAYPGGRCMDDVVAGYLKTGAVPGQGTLCPP